MKVVIIRYNAGNVLSVQYALERLGITPVITDNPDEIRSADKVVFPGVGEASTTMAYLRQRNLDKVICSLRQPVLGICLGMQLLCRHSEENDTNCLGLFNINVRKFPALQKVPHIGWNTLNESNEALFTDIGSAAHVYYVHSYYAELAPETISTSDYILPFSAALCKDNFYGVQFHPEKSGATGAKILSNFLRL